MAAPKSQLTSVDKLKSYESSLSTVFGFIIVVAIGVGLLFLLRRTTFSPNSKISESGSQTQAENLMKSESSDPSAYTVQSGDNLWKIASDKLGDGYQWVTIATANGLTAPYVVTAGQTLKIPAADPKIENLMATSTEKTVPQPTASPAPQKTSSLNFASGATHTVTAGESLWSVAVKEYNDGYKWVEIYQANKKLIGPNPGIIRVGQSLVLPTLK